MTIPNSAADQHPTRSVRRRWLGVCFAAALPLAAACSDDDSTTDTPTDSGGDMDEEMGGGTDVSGGSVMFPNGSVMGETDSEGGASTP